MQLTESYVISMRGRLLFCCSDEDDAGRLLGCSVTMVAMVTADGGMKVRGILEKKHIRSFLYLPWS